MAIIAGSAGRTNGGPRAVYSPVTAPPGNNITRKSLSDGVTKLTRFMAVGLGDQPADSILTRL
eukprot:181090-Hanusia_phi.AAC.1